MTKLANVVTVKLGEGSTVRFPQAVINAGSTGATIQFGTISKVVQFLPADNVSNENIKAGRPFIKGPELPNIPKLSSKSNKPNTHVPIKPKQLDHNNKVMNLSPSRVSVFDRLSKGTPVVSIVKGKNPEAKLKSIVVGSLNDPPKGVDISENVTMSAGTNNHEASSSGVKMSRKARRKYNAKCRAAGIPVHCEQVVEPLLEATIPTKNNFEMLKWVKRNDSNGKIKKSFWDVQPPTPQLKKEETISSKIYKVLKAVKSRNFQRKYDKYERRIFNYNPKYNRNTQSYYVRPNQNKRIIGDYRSQNFRNMSTNGRSRLPPPQRQQHQKLYSKPFGRPQGVKVRKHIQRSRLMWAPKETPVAKELIQSEVPQPEEWKPESPIIYWKRRIKAKSPVKDDLEDSCYWEDDDFPSDEKFDSLNQSNIDPMD